MIMRRAVLDAPSRSTTVCNGSVRWFFPAAVMTAFLISIKAQPASQELAKPSNFSVFRVTVISRNDFRRKFRRARIGEFIASNALISAASLRHSRAPFASERDWTENQSQRPTKEDFVFIAKEQQRARVPWLEAVS